MLVAIQGRRHRAGRATYKRRVSVALHLSASDSAAAPASPTSLSPRLQRGEDGQRCSWRDRAAGTELAARLTRASSASSMHSQAYHYSPSF
jgi:hypothetical protein